MTETAAAHSSPAGAVVDRKDVSILRPEPVRWPHSVPWLRLVRERRPAIRATGAALATSVVLAAFVAAWVRTRTVCGGGNETSAIATLRYIGSCQEEFRAGACVDSDGDGVGEFGGLLELAGAAPVRGSIGCLDPPLLSGAFRTLTPRGEARRSGYLFRMYLVGADGVPVGESAGTSFYSAPPDADRSEVRWVCYAWPSAPISGTRTFAVDWNGNLVATSSGAYVGAVAPGPDAAFGAGGMRDSDRTLFDGTAAADGNVWRLVN